MFFFVCGIKGCMQGFKCGSTFSSYRNHANRHHPGWQVLNTNDIHVYTSHDPSSSVLRSDSPPCSLDDNKLDDQSQCTTSGQLDMPNPFANVKPEEDPQRIAAKFLLTLKEKYNISQAAVNFTLSSISSIVDSVCNSCFDHSDPFDLLLTECQQTKFYKEEFGLVVSDPVNKIKLHSL